MKNKAVNDDRVPITMSPSSYFQKCLYDLSLQKFFGHIHAD